MRVRRPTLATLVAIAWSLPFPAISGDLPVPTGEHPVGRVSLCWADSKRAGLETREIVVRIWYPAARAGSVPAAYMPGIERLRSSTGAGALSKLFGPNWSSIASGELKSHSYERVPIVPGAKFPVLVFSPGGGTTAIAYTTQMEELASHGYVVVGVEHPSEAPGMVCPDGHVVKTADEFWDRARRDTPDAESFEKEITEAEAVDVVFVIDRLAGLGSDRESVFYSRLDMNRIGVFGHSRGGRNAARVCQLERRVKACLNQDGSFSLEPFWLDQNGRSMEQPFMMIDHLDPELPAEVFTKMGTNREAYAQKRSARQAEAREKLYGTVAGGSYHVTIKTPGISHNSFLDVRQLGRPDAGTINIWPKDVQAATPHLRILNLITTCTRVFFDKTLRGVPGLVTDLARGEAEVEVRVFGAAAK